IIIIITKTANAQYIHDSLKVDQGYIHYYTKGEGESIVLLQGGPGYSSYYMRGIADSLTNYQSILIDYQGTGRSQYKKVDSTWVTRTRMIKDVELVRNHLGIDKWTLIGNSYGSHLPSSIRNTLLKSFLPPVPVPTTNFLCITVIISICDILKRILRS